MITEVVQITYSIKVMIKHDCWNEFGEGAEVSMPIYLAQKWEPISILNDKLPIAEGEPEYKDVKIFVDKQTNCKYSDDKIMPRIKKEYEKCEHYHDDALLEH